MIFALFWYLFIFLRNFRKIYLPVVTISIKNKIRQRTILMKLPVIQRSVAPVPKEILCSVINRLSEAIIDWKKFTSCYRAEK